MSLSSYLAFISQQGILTEQQERELVATYQNQGLPECLRQRAKDKLVRGNLRFILQKAREMSADNFDHLDEMVAAGNEGIAIALNKFDPSKGWRFLTYAGWWVFQCQVREKATLTRTVAVPLWKQQALAQIRKVQEVYGAKPTLEQYKEMYPKLTAKIIAELTSTIYPTYSIEDTLSRSRANDYNGSEEDWSDRFLPPEMIDQGFVDSLMEDMDRERLYLLMEETLNAEEKNALLYAYGIDPSLPAPENLRGLKRAALLKVRRALAKKKEANPPPKTPHLPS